VHKSGCPVNRIIATRSAAWACRQATEEPVTG
jgi:hypothetical protein